MSNKKDTGTKFFTFELLDEPEGFGTRHVGMELELAAHSRQTLKCQVWQQAKKAGLLGGIQSAS